MAFHPLRIKVNLFILVDKVQDGVKAPMDSLPFYPFLSAMPHFSLGFKHPDLPPLALQRTVPLSAAGLTRSSDSLALQKSPSQQGLSFPPNIHVCALHFLADHSASSSSHLIYCFRPESSCP